MNTFRRFWNWIWKIKPEPTCLPGGASMKFPVHTTIRTRRDDWKHVPLREGEISHEVRGNEHKVMLRAMAVCHYCRAPIAKLGDPCPYDCPGYMEATRARPGT